MKTTEATNYLKLSVRLSTHHEVVDMPVTVAPERTAADGCLVVSWVFPFTSKAQAAAALLEAQGLRKTLREIYQDVDAEAFKLSTFKTSPLRGVPVLGNLPRAAEPALELVS